MKKFTIVLLLLALFMNAMFASFADTPLEAGEYLKKLSIVQGDEKGDLKPLSNLTREESIIILLRMLNEEKNALAMQNVKSEFKDVPDNHWAIKHIMYAKSKGLAAGIGDGKFGLTQKVTTKEFVSFMLRALKHTADWGKEDIMKKAEQMDLLDDIMLPADKQILRGDSFVVLKNTLHAKVNNTDQTLLEVLKLSANDQSSAGKLQSDWEVSVSAIYANIELILVDGSNEIRVDPNGGDYTIESKPVYDKTYKITITGNKVVKKGETTSLKPVKIYVPATAWDDVDFNLQTSTLKASKVFKSGEIEFNISDSEVSVELLNEFRGNITINANAGVKMDLVSQDKFKDGTFSVVSLGVVNVPQKDPKDTTPNREFVHVEINASSDTVINLK